jgi:transcriptional regulator with XRE-family HTH domain
MISLGDEERLVSMGKRLRELRKEKRMSLRMLAEKTGVDNSKIAKVETGQINITFIMLLKLLDGLSVKLEEFFDPRKY